MNNLLLYLIQVTAGSILLYLCFVLFYRNDTFYLRNRILLILSIVLPVTIPLISLTFKTFSQPAVIPQNIIDNIIVTGINMNQSVSGSISSLNISDIILWLWITVTFALIIRIFTGVIRTFIIIRRGEIIRRGTQKIVVSDLNHPPFSFYPYAVIPREVYQKENNNEVFAHEAVHIRQFHTIDLLLSELFIAFFWFNPVAWMIRKSIVLNHEYLADNEIIHKTINIRDYQYRLLNIPAGMRSIPLAHNFSSNIKNRIVMINKKPTRNYAALKNILILPVVAILFVMFAFKTEPGSSKNVPQEPLFSPTSLPVIMKFLYSDIVYPQAAKISSDSGRVFVVVKMNKGGTIKECVAYTEKDGITVPFLNEIVIVAFGPGSGQGVTSSNNNTKREHPALKTECLRVANKLVSCQVPEWKEKNMEFALVFNFQLR